MIKKSQNKNKMIKMFLRLLFCFPIVATLFMHFCVTVLHQMNKNYNRCTVFDNLLEGYEYIKLQ